MELLRIALLILTGLGLTWCCLKMLLDWDKDQLVRLRPARSDNLLGGIDVADEERSEIFTNINAAAATSEHENSDLKVGERGSFNEQPAVATEKTRRGDDADRKLVGMSGRLGATKRSGATTTASTRSRSVSGSAKSSRAAPINRRASENRSTTSKASKQSKDNLRLIEGVGPKINKLLNKAGITTFEDLANTEVATLENILQSGGKRFQMHDPATWPQQANLAAEGSIDELSRLQSRLTGGRR